MKGYIRQRSKGSWEITIDTGRDPSTGKRRRHSETVKGAKKDAERRLAELLVSIERGSYIKPKKITLGEWLEDWCQSYAKTHCSPRTAEGYESIIRNHIIPSIGSVRLIELHPQHIQAFYAGSMSHGRINGKGGLSGRTVSHIHRVLSEALSHAVKQGLIFRNVAELIDPPRAKRAKMNTLTLEEIYKLFSVARNTPYYPIIYTALHTGLLQAELLGLMWRDVDLDLASLSVIQTLYKRRGICHLREPKSEHSRRRIALQPSLAVFLREYRAERETQWLLLGKLPKENDFVFGSPDDKPMDPGTLTHAFAKIARKANIFHIRFHDLRHTHASLMLMSGIHPKIVQERLGHASVAFTLDVYSHSVPDLQDAAAKRLDEILQTKLKQIDDVGKMSASGGETDIANGQIRTDDRRFTKPLLYP